MPIACWTCHNLDEYVQVSGRGDSRTVNQTLIGLRPTPWDRSDERSPGLYCARCQSPIEVDVGSLGINDNRAVFVDPMDFRVEPFIDELCQLRPDAEWTRLDVPERLPLYEDLPAAVHPALRDALDHVGRLPLFVHQAQAVEAALNGKNVVQATSAGSGKSLGFLIPAIHEMLSDPQATILALFPLRALANDQVNALVRLGRDGDPWINHSSFDLRLASDTPAIRVGRHDGATDAHERTEIRRHARLVVATPDSLHHAMLRHGMTSYRDGTSWKRFLSNVRFVILDEVHSYQGVFGSNVALVLRRFRRLTHKFGATPRFLAASATIGNPIEHVEKLTGVGDFVLVNDDGSGRRQRVVLICNPPPRGDDGAAASEPESGELDRSADRGRIAPQTVAIELAASGALASDSHLPVRTIAFCRSRNEVFQLTQRLRNRLKELRRSELAQAVAPYTATFLADDRVEAEGRLRDGTTLAVISTNALELGIDIPDLSLALLLGYPGQVSSFRQRAGRVGRRGEGLVVLIVGDDPLQQFIARDPEALGRLLAGQPEHVVINPDVSAIVKRYGLAPGQDELGGIAYEDAQFFGERHVQEWLSTSNGPPDVRSEGVSYWKIPFEGEAYASLRNAAALDSYTVVVQQKRERRSIGVIDSASAPRDAFVGAIWTGPEGNTFSVVGFDQTQHLIICEGPIDVNYQTRGVPVDAVTILDQVLQERAIPGGRLGYGSLEITRQVFSYKEQHFSGLERNRVIEGRRWPPVIFATEGFYLHLDLSSLDHEQRDGALRALEHVLLAMSPAVVAVDPFDFDATTQGSTIYLYDAFGGGLGISRVAFERFDEIVGLGLDAVSTCPCLSGCPSCIMLSRRPDGNRDLSKQGAIGLLRQLADR